MPMLLVLDLGVFPVRNRFIGKSERWILEDGLAMMLKKPNTKYYTKTCETHVEPDGRWRPAAIWLDVLIRFRSNMDNSLSQLQGWKLELVSKFDISYANSVNRGVYMLKQVNFSQHHFDEVVEQPVPMHDVRDTWRRLGESNFSAQNYLERIESNLPGKNGSLYVSREHFFLVLYGV